jgi:hypothetical protein
MNSRFVTTALTVEILQLSALRSYLHSRLCRNLVNCQFNNSVISSEAPLQITTALVAQILFFFSLCMDQVENTVSNNNSIFVEAYLPRR